MYQLLRINYFYYWSSNALQLTDYISKIGLFVFIYLINKDRYKGGKKKYDFLKCTRL